MSFRSLAPVCAAIVTSACSDDMLTSRPVDGPTPATVFVSGLLLDSLANRPIGGQFVTWAVGEHLESVRTGQGGEFGFAMPAGMVRLRYSDRARYEDFDETITVDSDTTIVIGALRTLPYLRNFSVTPAGVLEATIVDLQGTRTVRRDDATWVVVNAGTVDLSGAIPASRWSWDAVDAVTWRVSVSTGIAGISNAYWSIMADRYPGGFLCVAGESACAPDAPFPLPLPDTSLDPAALQLGGVWFTYCTGWRKTPPTPYAMSSRPPAVVLVDLLFHRYSSAEPEDRPQPEHLDSVRAYGGQVLFQFAFPGARVLIPSGGVSSLARSGLINHARAVADLRRYDWQFIVVFNRPVQPSDSAMFVALGGRVRYIYTYVLQGIAGDLPNSSAVLYRQMPDVRFVDSNAFGCASTLEGGISMEPSGAAK